MNLLLLTALVLSSLYTTSSLEYKPEILKSNKNTKIGENWDKAASADVRLRRDADSSRSRQKRAFEPSEEEIQLYLDLHNERRRREGASNMEFMEWNWELSYMAEAWGDLCRWEHGQPAEGLFNPPYETVGQNLYIINSNTIPFLQLINMSMIGFYDMEKPYYNFNTTECVPGEQCGHFTQVVWADSRLVGCSISYCEDVPLNLPVHFAGSLYLVCNYGPSGNIQIRQDDDTIRQQDPYLIGPACTQCSSKEFWCDQGLCRSKESCNSTNTECSCEAVCHNCGTIDEDTCSCSCARGFTGNMCLMECRDYHHWCNTIPGWPRSWCTNEETPYVKEYCFELCEICEPLLDGEIAPTCEPATITTTATQQQFNTTSTSTGTTTGTSTNVPSTRTSTTMQTTRTTQHSSSTSTLPATTPTRATTTPAGATTTPTRATTTSTATTTERTTSRIPTTSTIRTTSTEPLSPTTERDCSNYCQNGATLAVVNNECECSCTSQWQGDMCDERRDEARVGMIVSIFARIQVWDIIWASYLQPLLVRAVNVWCNTNVQQCCPGANMLVDNTFHSFATENEIVVGEGYPKEFRLRDNLFRTVGLFYAYGAQDNDLCSAALDTRINKRKRRDLPEMTLSQTALEEIVMSMAQNLTSTLNSCCNVTIETIEPAVMATEQPTATTQQPPFLEREGPLGLSMYIWVLGGVALAAIVTILITIATCCCCMSRNKKANKSRADKYRQAEAAITPSAPPGYDNHAYQNMHYKY